MTPELPDTLRVAILVIDVLDDLGVRYHLGGSVASSVHGVPRQTQDIDLVVELDATHVDALVARLGDAFHVDAESMRSAIRDRISFNLIHFESGIKIDLFPRGDRPFDREEFSRGRFEPLFADSERRVVVKSPEDTVLRKLLWYREGGEVSDRQWTDVLGVVRAQGERLDRSYLERWARELGVDDLLEIALGRHT
jgi:hypothetical protein